MAFYREVVLPHVDQVACLIWPFARSAEGYAKIRIGKRMAFVHREACKHKNGPPLTPKSEARHTCGNGHLGCVNQHHTAWGTRKENEADKIVHGTSGKKLTEGDIRAIRRHIAAGDFYRDIAAQFGVRKSTISSIKTGHTWGWVP